MARLGYDRYGAQGGDWGSAVTTALGAQDPGHCAGIHITLAMDTRPQVEGEPTAEEQRALKGSSTTPLGLRILEAAIDPAANPGLRPDRLAGGQAAWILEKFWAWTDCDGHPENIFTGTSCSTT